MGQATVYLKSKCVSIVNILFPNIEYFHKRSVLNTLIKKAMPGGFVQGMNKSLFLSGCSFTWYKI